MKKSKGKPAPGGDEIPMIQKLEFWPIERLKPYTKNSRTHSQEQVAELAASFTEFGVCQPVAVHEALGIVAGEGRYLAGQLLKLKKLPVINLSHLSPAKARAYVIADNRLAENSGWNDKLLEEELRDLKKSGEVDLKTLGFTDEELLDLLPELKPDDTPDPGAGGGGGSTSEIPKHPASRIGDLFTLGDHRLLVGNSCEKKDVLRLMGGTKADVVFTDPPYNIQGNGGKNYSNKGGKATRSDYGSWDVNFEPKLFVPQMLTVIKPNCHVFVCTSDHLFGDWQKLFRDAGAEGRFLAWCKTNPMPSLAKKTFVSAVELIIYASFGSPEFYYPAQGNLPNYFVGNVEAHSSGHPTQKPTYVAAYCLDHTSKPGAVVADFFGGVGTTLIHCEKIKRRCFVMEIEPLYCDATLDRWSEATGKDPVREDGTPWSRLKKTRK